jgi:hypothetical protein
MTGFQSGNNHLPRVTGLGHSFNFDRELSRQQDRNRRCVSVTPNACERGFRQ